MVLILLPEDNLECILSIVISKHSLCKDRLNNGETSTGVTSYIKVYAYLRYFRSSFFSYHHTNNLFLESSFHNTKMNQI
jgi:hypothetical protein